MITEDEFIADDIAVRFYEIDEEGNVKWEDYGNFANHDVHRQVMSPAPVSRRVVADKVR